MNPSKNLLKNFLPKSRLFIASLEIMQQFHNWEDLHSVAITQSLI